MGRTRLGRFAAVAVPATVVSAGLGVAILQGMVGAALSSATAFQVAGSAATGDELELTANNVTAANSEASAGTGTAKKDALVSLQNGAVEDLCLAADTTTPLGVLGIKITSAGSVSLGSGWTDLSADSLGASQATLPTTDIGYSQSDLAHQDNTTSSGYADGGFSLATDVNNSTSGGISLTDLDASVYALTLNGLTLNNLSISPTLGSVEGTC
ncbi:DUF6230 family protein [Nocardioides sp.]|uniref:DUF6230 family protein n=1 Tax=Nocardioides sp. TaxID=35761 RepID=UPI0039E2610E